MDNSDQMDLIKDHVKSLEEAIDFYSAGKKAERERWVASAFATNLNIDFEASEIVTPDQDPPDVVFREAQFEIKEILDPDRKRHKEYKEKLEYARSITDPEQLLEQFTPIDMSISDIYLLCLDKTKALVKYPPDLKACTDLLFYVNLQNVMGLSEVAFPDTAELDSEGWRSVSFVKGHRSCVLSINSGAPDFIAINNRKISHRNGYE